MTFHVGDTVTLTNTEANIAEHVDGEDARVTRVSGLPGREVWTVQGLDWTADVHDPADLTLSDCPHEGDQ